MFSLKLMGKLMLGFGLVLLIMLGVCAYLLLEMKNTDNSYSALIESKAYAYAQSQAALAQYNEAVVHLKNYVISGSQDDLNNYRQALADGDAYLQKVASLLETQEGKRLIGELQNQRKDLEQYGGQIIPLVQARAAAQGAERASVEEKIAGYVDTHKGVFEKMIAAGEAFENYEAQLLDSESSRITAGADRTVRTGAVFAGVVFLAGLFLALFIARTIAGPIRQVDAEAARIASGDLSGAELAIKTKDEAGRLAQSFNAMQKSLREIVSQLQNRAQSLSASAASLSASAEGVSAGATETAATIAEVAATVEQVTGNTQRIAAVSQKAADYARQGRAGLQGVVRQMDEIQKVAAAGGEIVHELIEASGRITQIIDLITQIADQTNLLALNAAIEAARAGEHGRGFAVVAEEVRKLAGQSAEAAKEIQDLIANVQRKSEKAVQGARQNAAQVEAGVQAVKETGSTFEEIISSVQELAKEIQSVAAAAEEMSSAVQNVAAAAEEQTATMEEVSATAQGLAGLADELEKIAGRFRLG